MLDLAARGATNAEIGVTLRISVSTVEAHMTQTLAKLSVQSRTAAANVLYQALTRCVTLRADELAAEPSGGAAR